MTQWRVLIVEDSPEDRVMYRRLIAQWSDHECVVFETSSGKEGLELLRSEEPDCVLLDYNLPDIDGLEFLAQLAGEDEKLSAPIVVLTGGGSESVAVEAMKRGAADYLVKSTITSESLLLAVTNAMEKKALQQELSDKQEELRQSAGQLSRANETILQSRRLEALGRLAGGVAHDFNNLLTVIMGYSESLVGGLDDYNTVHEKATEISKAAGRAADLTRQLLAFGRKQPLQPKVLDLNALLRELDKMLRRLVPEHIEIGYSLDPSLGWVKVDPAQIEQVIMNLAANARDAMPQGGTLTIETANVELDDDYASQHVGVRPGPYVMLSVSDTGCGMDAETREHIFEPFYTTKDQGHGTGLGLATVYGIVKQSGGNVWVYSEPGLGTTFKTYLPRAEEALDSLKPISEHIDEAPGGSETVLLVEDEDKVRELVRAALLSKGYTVLATNRPRDALKIGERHKDPIHLVLTDVVMPQMNGRELAERVMSMHQEAKALYISGYASDAIGNQGLLEPNITLLQKPFTPKTLLHKVREVLDRPSDTQVFRARVLIIDDEEQVRGMLRSMLEGVGCKVFEASNGDEGLSQLRETVCDLVITDIVMPEKDGIATCIEIKREFPRIKVIATSGATAGHTYLSAAKKLGATAILHKPFSKGELLQAAHRALFVQQP